MTVATDIDDDTFRETKTPHLRVLTGGKGPPKPPEDDGHNWLSEMVDWTVFVCRNKRSKEVDLNHYCVLHSQDDVVLLSWRLPDGKVLDYYVDPVRFSKENEHVIILGVQRVAKEENESIEQGEVPSDA